MLTYADVTQAAAWLQAAFGFRPRVRVGEAHRVQMSIGTDGAVIVTDAGGNRAVPSGDGVTHMLKVRVEDVDAAFARARDAGATVISEPHTWEYGERAAVVADPGGHHWELQQTVRDVDPEEWGGVVVEPW